MSLRKATLWAAAGIAAGILAGTWDQVILRFSADGWLSAWYFLSRALLFLVFAMLYRELGGGVSAGRRQDLALLATIVSGIQLHTEINWIWQQSGFLRRTPGEAAWTAVGLAVALLWIAFLVLLVKDAAPWSGRGMSIVAPILALLTALQVTREGKQTFFRVGLGWLSLGTQRGVAGLFWNLLLQPAIQLFAGLSMTVFLLLLWYSNWIARKKVAGR